MISIKNKISKNRSKRCIRPAKYKTLKNIEEKVQR